LQGADGFATSDGSFLALYVHDPGKVVGSILPRGFMFGNFSLAQYYQDQIGSTRMVRNHNNQLNNLYEYDPYGNALTTYGTESFNYYRFTGKELDKDSSNFYSFPYRYYAPELQRWMKRDPIPSGNLYAYVSGCPLSRTDPVGLFWEGQPHDPYFTSPSEGWHYGNWCGVGYSSGIWTDNKEDVDWSKATVDKVDTCCKRHDFQMQSEWSVWDPFHGSGPQAVVSGLCRIQHDLWNCLVKLKCLSPDAASARRRMLTQLGVLNLLVCGPPGPPWVIQS